MVEKNTLLAIGAIITLLLATSGTYFLAQDDDAYYCESRDMVMICEKLSSGIGTRCYFEDTYKICKEGWVKIELGQEIIVQEEEIKGDGWLCSPDGCVRIK